MYLPLSHDHETDTLPSNRRRQRIIKASIAIFTTLAITFGASKRAWASSTSLPMQLDWTHLTRAAMLVAGTSGVGVGLMWQQPKIARDMLQAAVRCSLQLNLIGGMVLTHFLLAAQTRPLLVGLWMTVSGILAAQEAAARVEYTYPKLKRHLTIALLAAGASVMGLAALLGILGPIQPWYSPRTWIPISGMLFGNALTAAGLAAASWTRELATKRSTIELRLCRGASWSEAVASVIRSALTAALTPTINALSVTGIVHLPGMLTGQILAGQAPHQAAAYQVLIFFLIAATSSTAVQTFLSFAVEETIDKSNDSLYGAEGLVPVGANKKTDRSPGDSTFLPLRLSALRARLLQSKTKRSRKMAPAKTTATVQVVERAPTGSGQPLLTLKHTVVDRTSVDLSLSLQPGDRVAIRGPSGIGKSQILRTIAGLEPLDRHSVVIEGLLAADVSMPEWRRRVALVPQERPALEGTPRDFYEEAARYTSQRRGPHVNGDHKDPANIAEAWGMAPRLFDEPWATLSGGEAQRASLAIALALDPDVILLDESTSALDDFTAQQVEKTLKKTNKPILMVSHSSTQVERFCNDVIDLNHPVERTLAF